MRETVLPETLKIFLILNLNRVFSLIKEKHYFWSKLLQIILNNFFCLYFQKYFMIGNTEAPYFIPYFLIEITKAVDNDVAVSLRIFT